VEIEGFDGRNIHYGGIAFDGSARHVYWNTLGRYLKIKNGEIFDKLENELRTYPPSQIESTILETKAIVRSFVQNIAHSAADKDRILRGDGINFPPLDQGRPNDLQHLVNPQIDERAQSLRQYYGLDSRLKRAEHFFREYSELTRLMIALGAGAVIGSTFTIFFRWLANQLS
jgi:hypothetical protein